MTNAYILLTFLVVGSPAFAVIDEPIMRGLLVFWAAVCVLFVGAAIRTKEAEHAWSCCRAIVALALVPAALMVVQLIPLPYGAHPIWRSAAVALNEPLTGTISADPAQTAMALGSYFTAFAIVIATQCVAIDRRRAQLLLRILVIVTGLATLTLTGVTLTKFGPVTGQSFKLQLSLAANCNFAIVLSAALFIHEIDQYRVQGRALGAEKKGAGGLLFAATVFAGSVLIAAIVLPGFVFIAGLCGLAPIVLTGLLRHISTQRWESYVIIGIVVGFAIVLGGIGLIHSSGDIAIRLAAGATPEQLSIAQRMITDAGPLGTGAGTYQLLAPVYRAIDDPQSVSIAPTTAAAISVELGRSALAGALLLAGAVAFILFRRALKRGRDAAYAAAGSGCVITMILQGLSDASLLQNSVLIVAAASLGLAVGQSKSQLRG